MPHIHRGSPIIILSPLEDDPTIVDAVRDLRLELRGHSTFTEQLGVRIRCEKNRQNRLRGAENRERHSDDRAKRLGAYVMDWEPDMLIFTALAGARGF